MCVDLAYTIDSFDVTMYYVFFGYTHWTVLRVLRNLNPFVIYVVGSFGALCITLTESFLIVQHSDVKDETWMHM